MKHLIQLLMLLLVTLQPFTTAAHDFEVDGIYYEFLFNQIAVTFQGDHLNDYPDCYSGEVIIPDSVTYEGTTYPVSVIGNSAFYGRTNLTSVHIPNTVTVIYSCAFQKCTGLTSIDIPNSVTTIYYDAFRECTGLTSANIGNSVTYIGETVFLDCTGLTSVHLGNSVTTIGNSAFSGCSSLCDINLPNSVTSIGELAFKGCAALPSLAIPNSVTSIGGYFLYGCSGLTSLTVEEGNPVYDSREDCNAIIETSTNTLIAGCQNTIIPNTITNIGKFSFYQCTGLTSINIPNSVTTISRGAFWYCSNLTDINIPNSVTTIEGSVFMYCKQLSSIVLPNSVTSIGEFAFRFCYNLSSITIPSSITHIGEYSFCYCNKLNDVYCYITDPSTVTMGAYAMSRTYDGSGDYSNRTLYVPIGSAPAYQADTNWSPYFASIVEMGRKADSIKVDNTEAVIRKGETLLLTAIVEPDYTENKTVVWASSDPSVASVDENGLVTALADGTAIITATTTDGSDLTASCTVTVKTVNPGNVNDDSSIDIDDVALLIGIVLGNDDIPYYNSDNADLNNDGKIDIDDITAVIVMILSNNH